MIGKKKRISKFFKILIVGIFLISLFLGNLSLVKADKLNMSYLYYGGTENNVQYVKKTDGSIDTVSPSYLDLFADGSLDEKVDSNFVKEMHKMNVKVVPFISNHWDREKGRAALKNRESLAVEIVEVINKYDLDGVHVDLENLTESDRDEYVDLMRILREKLPKDKEVSVAVAANPRNLQKGWHGSYDYEKLAKYSDYLMIMAYDESYYGSDPGAVASLPFVEKSIEYALERVPSEKIVLGIPFYGRYWQDGSKGGKGIPIYRAEELKDKYNGKEYFDQSSKTPYLKFTVPYGESPQVHYWTLSPGKYTVWYENDKSIKYKLRLVQKYDLLGTASWSLNEAPQDFWDYYDSWLNGEHYFIDTENHWAEADILTMYNKGWMLGTSDENFSPNKPLTRAQGTVVLVRALGLESSGTKHTDSSFVDVNKNYWASKEIEIAFDQGIINGIGEGRFGAEEPLTREQMAAMLVRIFDYKDKVNITAESDNPYNDIASDHWAYEEILILNKLDIFKGLEDGGFHPEDNVTRAQMAALMNRVADDF